MRAHRSVSTSILMLTCWVSGALAAPALFRDATDPQARHASVEAGRSRLVTVTPHVLSQADEVLLNLFDDRSVTVRRRAMHTNANGLVSWSSETFGRGLGQALAVLDGDRLVARIEMEGEVYEVVPAEEGLHRIVQLSPHALAADGAPLRAPRTARKSQRPVTYADMREVHRDVANVLVVYTQQAAGYIADLEARIQLAVDITNTAYENSGMTTRIRLAHMAELPYGNADDGRNILPQLRDPNDGVLDEAHDLRNGYLADLVVLVSHLSDGVCGRAYQMQAANHGFAESAFSMVVLYCINGGLNFAHELGHNMGCQHERANAPLTPAFPYAYGYQEPHGDFRTIMATSAGCMGSCPQAPHFANPDIAYLGLATGIPAESEDAAACALAIDAGYETVKRFRDLVPPTAIHTSSDLTDGIRIDVDHPWPYLFRIYRASPGSTPELVGDGVRSPFLDTGREHGTTYEYWASAFTAEGEESEQISPIPGTPLVPVCTNGIIEAPAESCDDGNAVSGDGCSATCIYEPHITEDGAVCIAEALRQTIGVGRIQGHTALDCLAGAQTNSTRSFDICVDQDDRDAEAARKDAIRAEPPVCHDTDFGYAGMAVALEAAMTERKALVRELLGDDLESAAIRRQEPGARCQKVAAKTLDNLMHAYLRDYADCVRTALEDRFRVTPDTFVTCLAVPRMDGRLYDHAARKVAAGLAKACDADRIGDYLPGACRGTSSDSFGVCLQKRVLCRGCRTLRAGGGFTTDCDTLDDGIGNGTCAP